MFCQFSECENQAVLGIALCEQHAQQCTCRCPDCERRGVHYSHDEDGADYGEPCPHETGETGTPTTKASDILRRGWVSLRDLAAHLGCSLDEASEIVTRLGARQVQHAGDGYGWTLVDHAPPPRRGGILNGQWFPDLA